MKNLIFSCTAFLTLAVNLSAFAQHTLPDSTVVRNSHVYLWLCLEEGDALFDYNFDYATFSSIYIDSLSDVKDCSFKDATFWNGHICVTDFQHCDFTNAFFTGNFSAHIDGKVLAQTKNHRVKKLEIKSLGGNFQGFDFSDYEISCYFYIDGIETANFENTYFHDAQIPPSFFQRNLLQTRNYKIGVFTGLNFYSKENYRSTLFQTLNLSDMVFTNCILCGSFAGTDITNTIFTECDLQNVTRLTLEQVKSTWNYKTGKMNLCKWPAEIMRELENEK